MSDNRPKKFYNLSEEEIDQFLEKIKLHRYQEGECRLEYLNKAVRNALEWIPFQTVFLHAVPKPDQRALTIDEIKYQMTTGKGGCCVVINPFFYSILLSQGYDAILVHSSNRNISENHQCIIVENVLEQGDKYMVDVGNAFMNAPLKLDFEKKSEIQYLSFQSYYYEWDDETKQILHRIHTSDDYKQINNFVPFQDFEELMKYQKEIFFEESRSPACHKFLRMVRYLPTGAVVLRNRDFYLENTETRKLELKDQIQDLEQYLKYSDLYFPMIDRNTVITSYNTFYAQS